MGFLAVVDSVEEARALRQLLDAACHRLGDKAPASWRTPTFAIIGQHSPSLTGSGVAAVGLSGDDAPMTHTEAARFAGCSTATIGRRVADGTLQRVGRRVTAASVKAWCA